MIRIYEPTILQKLGLSQKFSHKILYTRKSALGIGILKPSTIVDTLAIKLYIGHKQQKSRIAALIQVNKEEATIQYSIYNHPITILSN